MCATWPWIFAPVWRKIRSPLRSQRRGRKQEKEGTDPEVNAFSKLVSGRLKAQTVGPHPGPEVLAAFAENALPDAERAQLLQHLGDCSDCRDVVYLAMPESDGAQKVLSFPRHRL